MTGSAYQNLAAQSPPAETEPDDPGSAATSTFDWVALRVAILLTLASFAFVWGLREAGPLRSVELRAYDALVLANMRGTDDPSPVVVYALTEDEIQDRKLHFPIQDKELYAILKKLLDDGATAVGIDIFRDISVPNDREDWHERLSQLFQKDWYERLVELANKSRRTYFATLLDGNSLRVRPPEGLNAEDHGGFANFPIDSGGVARRLLVTVEPDESSREPQHYSLAYRLAVRYLSKAKSLNPVDKSAAGTLVRLLDPDVLDWSGTKGAYNLSEQESGGSQLMFAPVSRAKRGLKTFPLNRVLETSDSELADEVRGKVVLVGVNADSVKDVLGTSLGTVAGVEVHAMATEQLIHMGLTETAPMRSWLDQTEFAYTLVWAALGGALGLIVRRPARFLCVMVFGAGLILGIAVLAFRLNTWIPVVPPFMTWMTAAFIVTQYQSFNERNQRIVFKSAFEPFVSSAVADLIWRFRGELLRNGRLEPRDEEVTVLFSDIQDFASFARTMPPSALMSWLNRYMASMSKRILRTRGMVVKYMGDGIMATFGAPLYPTSDADRQRDAANAVACAVLMRRALARRQARWAAELSTAKLCIRIGIFTGKVTAGTLGGGRRLEYTVIGDTVNIASRIEGCDKARGGETAPGNCRILIGEPTAKLVSTQFALQEFDEVPLKGIPGRFKLFAVEGRKRRVRPIAARRVAAPASSPTGLSV